MTSHRTALVAALVAVALVVVGAVVLLSGDGAYAYRVGGRETSQQSVDDELRALAENEVLESLIAQNGSPPISQQEGSVGVGVGSGWVSLLVAQEVAAQEVERRDLETTNADRRNGRALAVDAIGGPEAFDAMPESFQDTIVDRWTAVAVLQRDLLADPPPEVQAEIDALCPSGRYVSHILVETEQEMAAVVERLAEGNDFAELASAVSIDTGSAAQGGALGCLDGSQFVEPFATVAATQPVDVVSAPFQTEFGYHVLLVTDDAPQQALDQVTIDAVLARAQGEKVDVDPRYGTWDASNGQVVPPTPPKP